MRIRRLDLIRIGPFTDQSLTFDEGDFGLHLVYGPNEGGKSSSLRALKQWLYGMPGETKSVDHFKHTYDSLRVGGVLEDEDGNRLACIRRKGGKTSLRAENDRTRLDPSELDTFLRRVTKEQFEKQFGIDLAQLVAGGREIVSSDGIAGQSLFAAGAGAANLQSIERQLKSECERLFLAGGSKPPINAALADLAAAKKKVREKMLPSKHWQAKNAALTQSLDQRKQLETQIQRLTVQVQRLIRIQKSLPTISELKDKRSALAKLDGVPNLGIDFSNRRVTAVSSLASLQKMEALSTEELMSLDQKIESLKVSQSILDHASAIEDLFKNLGQYREWNRKCPELKSAQQSHEAAASAALKQLGKSTELEHIDRWRIGPAERQRIRSLADQRSALMKTVQDARKELKRRDDDLHCSVESLEELPQGAQLGDVQSLRRSIAEAQKLGDRDLVLTKNLASLRDFKEQSGVLLPKLSGWTGDLEELARLPVPTIELINQFAAEFAASDKTSERIRDEICTFEDEVADAESQLEALTQNGDVPTEQELSDVRRQRDQTWKQLRDHFVSNGDVISKSSESDIQIDSGALPGNPALADVYESMVLKSDELGDRLRREAEAVAKKTRLLADCNRWTKSIAARSKAIREAESQRTTLEDRWRAIWEPAGIAALPPQEMTDWLARYVQLMELRTRIRDLEGECERDQSTIDRHRTGIVGKLAEIGSIADKDRAETDDTLSTAVDNAIHQCGLIEAALKEHERLSDRVIRLRSERDLARIRLEESEIEKKQWREQWTSAISVLDGDADMTAAEALVVLDEIDRLILDHDKSVRSAEQWQLHRSQIEAFETTVNDLVGQLGIELGDVSVEQKVADLHDLVGRTREQKAKRESLSDQRGKLQEKAAATCQSISQHQAVLKSLCAEANCNSVDRLPEIERLFAEKSQVNAMVLEKESYLREHAGGADLETFIADALSEDGDSLGLQITRLGEQLAELKSEQEKLSESIGGQQSELNQIDASSEAAAANQDAEEALSRLRVHAEQFVRAKLASAILKRAIERYRRQNQGPVLQRASELFSRLTLNAFSGLQADFRDDGESVLVGIRGSDDSLVGVDAMSEGTADQLFFALRVASLEIHFEAHPPVPFVVDDILVNFDDDRSAAALSVMAELSRKTQVILFTHHRHVVDLTRAAVPAGQRFIQSLDETVPIKNVATNHQRSVDQAPGELF